MINKISQTNNTKITNYISSGNAIVDQLGQMEITGDITPKNLYYTVLNKDGNPKHPIPQIISCIKKGYGNLESIESHNKSNQNFKGRDYDFDKLQAWFDGTLDIQDGNELLKTGTD